MPKPRAATKLSGTSDGRILRAYEMRAHKLAGLPPASNLSDLKIIEVRGPPTTHGGCNIRWAAIADGRVVARRKGSAFNNVVTWQGGWKAHQGWGYFSQPGREFVLPAMPPYWAPHEESARQAKPSEVAEVTVVVDRAVTEWERCEDSKPSGWSQTSTALGEAV